ncbi:hypothetical protein Pla108_07880 [Botrimarina colliarenosi]|uniref:DUF1343 domain-containing protein n=1 Tax=Botrimarina colliarenosi TaxID=2528001 RepID=A0A5C6AKZ5_9BACT|nr:DUF1343 domain-containing protein [Botrimarina colliarenosi]TWT99845.1 hypothetical protein Pla108_07880 [Botrimarina colliarenosi]
MLRIHVLCAVSLALFLLTPVSAAPPVLLGVDVLQRDGFAPLLGKRIGLITNHTGLDAAGRTTIDVLNDADEVNLVRLFGPEHGIRGELDQSQISDGTDGPTGLPIVSLYGPRRTPEPEHMEDLDALVFDIQDIGCRFYTYPSTMKLAMRAAADAGITFVVLDRPNPIDGATIEGPMRDADGESFVGFHTVPLRHGLTLGELAKLFKSEGDERGPIEVNLVVVPCEGWKRAETWDRTGLVWTDPSPNMRRLTQALLYPGVGIMETTNISVGRGTDTPFEVFGAPWIEDPRELAAVLNNANTPGVRFVPRYFTPTASKFEGERCGGVDVVLTNAKKLNAVDAGMAIAATLRRLYPDAWETKNYNRLLINQEVYQAVVAGASVDELQGLARKGLDAYRQRRAAVLLYP